MQSPPTLSELAQQVLRVIVSRNSIDGSSLLREMRGTSPEEIAKAIDDLRRNRLIEVGGSITPDDLPFSRFAVVPSAKSYVSSIIP